MRALLLVALLCGTASAEVELGAGFFGQATRYADQPNRNFGAAFEIAVDNTDGWCGVRRWQYFVELAVAGVSIGTPDFTDGVRGTMYRGGLGVRHIARRFAMPRLDFELGFEAMAALQDIEWARGGRDVRPELAAGFSWSFRFLDKVAVRTSIRAFFTSSPAREAACRGPCPDAERAITSGYMLVSGVAW